MSDVDEFIRRWEEAHGPMPARCKLLLLSVEALASVAPRKRRRRTVR